MTIENEDFLSVDTPIPGQNFACLSFVSPEKILENKNTYLIHEFLKNYCKDNNLSKEKITEEYDDYIYNNRDSLEKNFYEANNFQTTVRGLKVRGVYDTKREADVRAKVLQRKDKNFHVFVGQVGYWLPWDPNADDVEDEEYAETELNKLVKKYNENRKKKDVFYEQQKQESIDKINSENSKTKNNIFDSGSDPWLKNKEDNNKKICQLLTEILDNNMIPHHGPWEDHKDKINELVKNTCDNADSELKNELEQKLEKIGWCDNPENSFYDKLRSNLGDLGEDEKESNKSSVDLPENVVDIDN